MGRTPNSSLNKEIEEEVKAFTAARSGRRPPTDEEFLELENTVRELRAKCSKGGGGGDDGNRAGDGEDGGGSRGGSGKESRGSSRKVNAGRLGLSCLGREGLVLVRKNRVCQQMYFFPVFAYVVCFSFSGLLFWSPLLHRIRSNLQVLYFTRGMGCILRMMRRPGGVLRAPVIQSMAC